MGFYERLIFPWLNDKAAAGPQLERLRAAALHDARGRVVEIGFGSGLNLRHYPATVTSIAAIEPNTGMLDRAVPRIRAAGRRVDLVLAAAERLPFAGGVFDTAVSTLTLCSVADPAAVLREIHRVLHPHGHLIVVEHGLADDPTVARWQRRLTPIQRVVACGCELNRPILALLNQSGFRTDSLQRHFVPEIPRTHGWMTVGNAPLA